MKIHSSLLRIELPALLFTAFARAKPRAKKPTLLLFLLPLLAGGAAAAPCILPVLPNNGATSASARAPSTRYAASRAHYLITAAELAAAGFTAGTVPTSIGWTYSTAPGVADSAPLIVYMENTPDTTNVKSATWATAISSMTTVHNATTALPGTAGTFDITLTGGSPFTYTGGGLYIAYDWGTYPGTLSTTAEILCNTALVNGLKSANSAAATVAASSFRPETHLDFVCSATPTPTPTSTPTPPCSPVCNLTEGFDDITNLVFPKGWFMQNDSSPLGPTGWFQGDTTRFTAQSPAGTNSYIAADSNNTAGTGTGTISNWLLTPPVTLQNGAQLIFWTRTVDMPTRPDHLQVRMSTAGCSSDVGSTAMSVGNFATLLLDLNPTYSPFGYPNVWTPFKVVLSGLGSPVTGRLAFRYFVTGGGPSGANSDYIGLDSVQYSCNGGLPTPTPPGQPSPSPTCPPITVDPPTLPVGMLNVPYNQTITASGGCSPYTFTIVSGGLPPGLTLTAGGVISGTPTTAGSFTFTIQATDCNGCTGTWQYKITIEPTPTPTPTPTPCTAESACILVGDMDDFAAPDVPRSTSPSQELLAAYPGVIWKDLDDLTHNTWVGHTFTNLPPNICRAELTIRMKPLDVGDDETSNDAMALGLIGPGAIWAWSPRIESYSGPGGGPGTWIFSQNPATTFVLDLSNLPNGAGSPISIINMLRTDRKLDLIVEDDTAVDWIQLCVWTCCQPCNTDHNAPNLFVSCLTRKQVLRFDESGGSTLPFPFIGTGGGGEGVACLTDGGQREIFVANNGATIRIYDANTTAFLGIFNGTAPLGAIGALSLSPDGTLLYAADYSGSPGGIYAFYTSGSLKGTVAHSYSTTPWHDVRVGPFINGSYDVYATNFLAFPAPPGVWKFHPDLSVFPGNPFIPRNNHGLDFPAGMTFDYGQHLWVSNCLFNGSESLVNEYAPNGTFMRTVDNTTSGTHTLSSPLGLDVGPGTTSDGDIYVASLGNNKVLEINVPTNSAVTMNDFISVVDPTFPTPTPPYPKYVAWSCNCVPLTTPTPTPTPSPTCSPFFSENFDSVTAPNLPPGWVATNAVDPDTILWVTETTTPDSPPNDAFVNDPAATSDKYLDTPSLTISSGLAQLSFRNNYNLESTFDGGVLEVSSPNINAGAFTDITAAAVGGGFANGGYNGTISTAFGSPIAGRAAWTGNSGGYITTVVNLGPNVDGQTIKLRFRMASDTSGGGNGWHIDTIPGTSPIVIRCPTPTPTPSGTPTPTPTPPCPLCPIVISGTVTYCPNPVAGPVPNVTLTLTGTMSGSTLSDGSGNYTFSSLPSGGNYTVTPTKAALAPGSAGINTVDVIAVQRHFLNIAPLSGCRLTAADVNGNTAVNTADVVAIQRFALGLTFGTANVGKYQFTPASRTYTGLTSNQTGQNYNTLVFGDVASSFVHRPDGSSQDAAASDGPGAGEVPATVATLSLPNVAVDASVTDFIAQVTTTAIDAKNNLVGFQGDFTFDERVVTFQSEPVRKAGITAGDWNVSGNVLPVQPGAGPIRTLRVSAFSNDFTPLSGSGTLFELRMTRVSKAAQGTQLLWAAPPNQFIFIDADLNTQKPGYAASGGVTSSGEAPLRRAPRKPTPSPTVAPPGVIDANGTEGNSEGFHEQGDVLFSLLPRTMPRETWQRVPLD